MDLREWAAQHRDQVLPQRVRVGEVARLFRIIARHFSDALLPTSLDERFMNAFWACLTVAQIALRASGYRLRSEAHHYLAIESLSYTLGLSVDKVHTLHAYRRKRSRAQYEMAGVVSETEFLEAYGNCSFCSGERRRRAGLTGIWC